MVKFTVIGLPVTQGSMKALMSKSTRKPIVVADHETELRGWRRWVAWEARKAMGARHPFQGPVKLSVRFVLPRPKSVTRELPCVRPDLSKMLRAIEDAMTSIVYRDDSLICEYGPTGKIYGSPPRAEVEVTEL